MSKYCIVITSCNNLEDSYEITRPLIWRNLTNCIQSHSVHTTSKWKGEAYSEDEIVLTIYTKTALYEEVEKCILDNHKYDAPQIIQIPIMNGYAGYLEHIDEETEKLHEDEYKEPED